MAVAPTAQVIENTSAGVDHRRLTPSHSLALCVFLYSPARSRGGPRTAPPRSQPFLQILIHCRILTSVLKFGIYSGMLAASVHGRFRWA